MKTTRTERFLSFVLFSALLVGGCEPNAGAPETREAVSTPPVVDASMALENALSPTTAVDAETGVAYLSFFRKDGEQTDVFLSSRARGSADWSDPIRVNSVPGDASAHAQAPAQVVVSPDGHVYVAWTNSIPIEGRRFPASNLLFARSTDGGRTFTEQTTVNSDAAARSSSHTFHDVTVALDGTIYISWLDSRKRDAATAAQSAKPVQPASLGGHNHSAEAHLPGTEVWVAVSRDGGETFSEGTVVAGDTCQCCRTSLAVAEDGTVYLAWRHIFPGMERDMAIAHSKDGGRSFSAPTRIHADHWAVEGCPHSGPSLAIDAAGRLHAGWYTGEATRAGIYYASSDDGVTFTEPRALVTGVGVSQIKLSGNGLPQVLVAWEDKTAAAVLLGHTTATGLERTEIRFEDASFPAISAGAGGWLAVSQHESDAVILVGK